MRRPLASPAVNKPGLAVFAIPLPPAAKRPAAHPEQLPRLLLRQLPTLMTRKQILETHNPDLL
jgi:hypothetical protein